MPNPSELERIEQENTEEMRRISGTLNRDAFACVVIEKQIEEQLREIARQKTNYARSSELAEHASAAIRTAEERIASLQDTLNRLEKPRG